MLFLASKDKWVNDFDFMRLLLLMVYSLFDGRVDMILKCKFCTLDYVMSAK